jgi:hypothetical protein
MNQPSKNPLPGLRRRHALAAPLAAWLAGTSGAALLAACGGGGGDAGDATAGVQSYSASTTAAPRSKTTTAPRLPAVP